MLTVAPQLEAVLAERAELKGIDPDALLSQILQRYLFPPVPINDWERGLLAVARNCGVSLSDEALSSEGIYD